MRIEDVRAVATEVTVPGAPYSLRLGALCEAPGAEPRVSWSFDDPFYTDDQILMGTTVVRGGAEEVWRLAQLDAAWLFVLHVDHDWVPGVAPVRRRWGAEEAWDALLRYFTSNGANCVTSGDEVRGSNLTLRGVTPESWAAYLNDVTDRDPTTASDHDEYVVPAGTVEDHDLPPWVADELDFGFGDVAALRLTDARLAPD